MNSPTNPSFTAFVGIWADKKHDVCIQEANCKQREFAVIPHKANSINEWAQSLRTALQGIKQFDEAIEKIAHKHADCGLFSALPRAGPSLAPRLLLAFGEAGRASRMRQTYRNTRGSHR
jgi:hypothetical protein